MDSGATWSPIVRLTDSDRKLLNYGWSWGTVCWQKPDLILARRHHSGSVWFSEDRGASFRQIADRTWCFGFASPTVLLTGGTNNVGIQRSQDGGTTWEQVHDGKINAREPVLLLDGCWWLLDEGLAVSRDEGANWQIVHPFEHGYWGPLFSPNRQQIVVVDRQGVQLSSDAGATWQTVCPHPGLESERVEADLFTPGKTDHREMFRLQFTVDWNARSIYYSGDRELCRRPLP